jgi:hypothetical protein
MPLNVKAVGPFHQHRGVAAELQFLPGASHHFKINVGIDAEGFGFGQVGGHFLQNFRGVGVQILGLGSR